MKLKILPDFSGMKERPEERIKKIRKLREKLRLCEKNN